MEYIVRCNTPAADQDTVCRMRHSLGDQSLNLRKRRTMLADSEDTGTPFHREHQRMFAPEHILPQEPQSRSVRRKVGR